MDPVNREPAGTRSGLASGEGSDTGPISVIIADDHELSREAVRSVLATDDGFVVVGEAADAYAAFEETKRLQPDLVLMDIRMPGDGIKATRRIKTVFPDIHIVMITVSDDAQHLFEALRAGAQGYLLKNLAPEHWTDYLRGIVDDEAPLSGALARQILAELAGPGQDMADDIFATGPASAGERPAGNDPPPEPLTPRETEVLDLVARGLTNREIAKRLFIAENTVKNHLKNILSKWHVDNRTQLVRRALERGLLP